MVGKGRVEGGGIGVESRGLGGGEWRVRGGEGRVRGGEREEREAGRGEICLFLICPFPCACSWLV